MTTCNTLSVIRIGNMVLSKEQVKRIANGDSQVSETSQDEFMELVRDDFETQLRDICSYVIKNGNMGGQAPQTDTRVLIHLKPEIQIAHVPQGLFDDELAEIEISNKLLNELYQSK